MESSENKYGKGMITIVVILWLVVLGLGGWILYDKVINKDTKPEEPKQNEVEKPSGGQNRENNDDLDAEYEEELKNLDEIYSTFLKGNDSDVIVTETQTKSICYDMDDDGNEFEVECDVPLKEYKYKNYIVKLILFDGNDGNSITILDSNGEQLYYNDDVKTVCTEYIDEYDKSFIPFISQGKLYFMSYDETDCYLDDNEKHPYIKYGYIDLNSSNIKINYLNSFKSITFEGRAPLNDNCK